MQHQRPSLSVLIVKGQVLQTEVFLIKTLNTELKLKSSLSFKCKRQTAGVRLVVIDYNCHQ